MAAAPLYHAIYSQLRANIREGHYRPYDTLPGENELARDYGCSRVTIRKALQNLASDGLIERRQGRGTVVVNNRAIDPVRAEVTGFVENLLAMGLRTRVDVLHFAFERPPERIAETMGLPPNTQGLHTVRLRFYKDMPFSYSVAWVPEEIGQSFSRADLAAQPLTQLLRRAGIDAVRAHQRIFAKSADTIVAPLLGVAVGSPLLGIERRVEDRTGRIVEYLYVLYHPERYEFEITMESDPSRNDGAWQAAGREDMLPEDNS
ncbi:GntR family transcriptional regulator [Palleronia aestuarii]|uniref:GntR family transcriptional regulator n=1 Tax=Palleronia aestuarii TaxID=568105 RepID=A0A2W7N416_9RHOB|nr:GntR family transcriptional regulator [Palleronia aestuarii]PZX15105.1 GntR family transcriptional regulator [Palleronia aestuarii]